MTDVIAWSIAALVLSLLAGWILLRLLPGVRQYLAEPGSRMSRRVVIALVVVVGAAALLALGFDRYAASAQAFAVSGTERWVVSPLIYLSLMLCLLAPSAVRNGLSSDDVRAHLRSPVALLVLPLAASTAFELLRAADRPLDVAQGLALFGGFLVAYLVGSSSGRWLAADRTVLVWLVVAAGLPLMLLGVTPGSLPALGVPAALVLVHLGMRRGRPLLVRIAFVVLGVGSIAYVYVESATSNDPSDGLVLQMWCAAALTAVALVPRRVRLPAAGLALLVTIVGIGLSPIPSLSVGVGSDLSDLTLAQRAYETGQVFSALGADLGRTVLGLGPGATVDLSLSPDAATLAASGRDLARVTSVHLLTSYVLLKLGVVGVVWLAALLVWAGIETRAVFARRTPTTFEVALLCLFWCGVAAAVPAATFMFSNVLPPLALGVLRSLRLDPDEERGRRHRQEEPALREFAIGALPR